MHLRFATTLFVSAMLLFLCQPLVARMILPLLGGASSVWIICSLCFQALLLAGYAFAHLIGTWLSSRAQAVVHLSLSLSVLAVLPIAVDDAAATRLTASHPSLGLLALLLRTVGLPFFVLSTTSPLLQRWFAGGGEKDPYHLYAASNAGSMLALLGYPVFIEPLLTVRAQGRALQGAFVVYLLLLVACALPNLKARAETQAPDVHTVTSAIGWRERGAWIALAFAPSSLLLGATEYITMDVASVPLLWVLPLAAYLASFIVAFAKNQPVREATFSRVFAFVAILVTLLVVGHLRTPAVAIVGAHVLLVLIASIVCHRALANRRPHAAHLTEFYLLLSIGGVLGGVFNALVAPVLFDDLYELPIAVGAVCLGRAAIETTTLTRRSVVKELGLGALLGLVTFGLSLVAGRFDSGPSAKVLIVFAVPVFVAFVWSKHPVRYAVAIGALLYIGMNDKDDLQTLETRRNFFGMLKVGDAADGRFRLLVYGRTVHGRQALAERDRTTPLAYYHPTGPAGDVLAAGEGPRRIGVVGLGVGALAAYARPADTWTFFEINPDVVAVANQHFTFLRDARRHASISIEVGDGRLRLRDGSSARFDLLVLDAFTSDAIPMHLLTREALAVYQRSLRPGGALLAHVSNLAVRLQPQFGALARDAGLRAIERSDTLLDEELRAAGKDASEWVLLFRESSEAEWREGWKPGWTALAAPASQPVWTDDFSNVLGALR